MRYLLLLGIVFAYLSVMGCASKGPYQPVAQKCLRGIAANHSGSEFINSAKTLPASIREEFDDLADAGERFSEDCTGWYPHTRFMGGVKSQDTYFVAVEQGGRAYGWFLTEFVLDRGGKVIQAKRIEPEAARRQPTRPLVP
jgi:hypothetical protein